MAADSLYQEDNLNVEANADNEAEAEDVDKPTTGTPAPAPMGAHKNTTLSPTEKESKKNIKKKIPSYNFIQNQFSFVSNLICIIFLTMFTLHESKMLIIFIKFKLWFSKLF